MQPHLCFPVFDGLEENCKQIVNVGKNMLKIVEALISCRHFGLAVLGLSSGNTERHSPTLSRLLRRPLFLYWADVSEAGTNRQIKRERV